MLVILLSVLAQLAIAEPLHHQFWCTEPMNPCVARKTFNPNFQLIPEHLPAGPDRLSWVDAERNDWRLRSWVCPVWRIRPPDDTVIVSTSHLANDIWI